MQRLALPSFEHSGTGTQSRLTGTRSRLTKIRSSGCIPMETRSRKGTMGGSLTIPQPRSRCRTLCLPVEDAFEHEFSIPNVQLINRDYCGNEYRQILYTIALHGVKVMIHACILSSTYDVAKTCVECSECVYHCIYPYIHAWGYSY